MNNFENYNKTGKTTGQVETPKRSIDDMANISIKKAFDALEKAKNMLDENKDDDKKYETYKTEIHTQGVKILGIIKSIEDGNEEITPAELNRYVDELNAIIYEAEGSENKKAA